VRDLCHAFDVVSGDRLLEESERRVFDAAHVGNGFSGGPTLVGVGADEASVAVERFADAARALRVVARIGDADLDLEGDVASACARFASSISAAVPLPVPTMRRMATRSRRLEPSRS
jgi:hypothetical protein